MDDFDFNKLRLSPDLNNLKPQPALRLPRHKKGEKFLKGPIPENWLKIAMRQKGKALHVAIRLWQLCGMANDNPTTTLSLSKMEEVFGIKHSSASRGLKALEQEKLVSVERHRGRSPIVTILEAPENCVL